MTTTAQVHDIAALFQADLIGPEKILWTERPEARPLNRPLPGRDLWFVPLGVVSLLLGIVLIFGIFFLLSQQHSMSWAALLPLAMIPHTVAALGLGYVFCIYPFEFRYCQLPNTYYAVTDQRLLILCTWPKRSLRMLSMENICDSQSVACPNGRRTIHFSDAPELRGYEAFAETAFSFASIQDCDAIEKLIDDVRKRTEENRGQKANRYPTKSSRWQRISAALALLLMAAGGLALYSEIQIDSLRRRQEFAKSPHTARILGYQITFPKEIPEGYNAGSIDLDYSDDLYDRESGRQGRTRRATLDLWPPEKSPFPSGIQFMVNEFAQPDLLPEDWQAPLHWKRLQRTSLGTKEVGGIKFAVIRCTAEVYYWPDEKNAKEKAAKDKVNEERFLPTHGYNISAVEYLAHDDGKIIGLRGYGYGDKNAVILLTDSAFNTFRKIRQGASACSQLQDSPDADPYRTASDDTAHSGTAIDPYAELIKP